MGKIVDVNNDLTDDQKQALSEKLEKLIGKYTKMSRNNMYFAGVTDGLNHAHKLINEINDDYNSDD